MTALLRAIAGLVGWAIGFVLLYGLQGVSCAWGWDGARIAGLSAARVALVAAYLCWVAAQAWLCWHFRGAARGPDLLDRLAFAIAVIGLVSAVYTGLPVIGTTICS